MRAAALRLGLAGVAAALLVAGCSGSTPGSPFPTGGGSGGSGGSPVPSSSATAGPPGTTVTSAPKVTTPLDTTKYQRNPCSVLSAAQTAEFGAISSKSGNSSRDGSVAGPACVWGASGNPVLTVGIGFYVQYQAGLPHGLAWDFSKGGALLRLPDVDGQPALLVPLSGECQIDVGATDDVMYRVDVQGDAAADLCGLTKKFATEMTTTMKSGG